MSLNYYLYFCITVHFFSYSGTTFPYVLQHSECVYLLVVNHKAKHAKHKRCCWGKSRVYIIYHLTEPLFTNVPSILSSWSLSWDIFVEAIPCLHSTYLYPLLLPRRIPAMLMSKESYFFKKSNKDSGFFRHFQGFCKVICLQLLRLAFNSLTSLNLYNVRKSNIQANRENLNATP